MNNDIVILANVFVSLALFLATLYRIKIERDQVKTIIRNAESNEKLRDIRKIVRREKDEICKMQGKELYDFLEEILKDGDE